LFFIRAVASSIGYDFAATIVACRPHCSKFTAGAAGIHGAVAVNGLVQAYTGLKAALGTRTRIATVLIYSFATAQPQLTAGLLAVLYTRIFTLQQFGVFGVLTALVGFLTIVVDLGLPAAIVRTYYDHHEDSARVGSYLSSVVNGSAILSFAVLVPVGLGLWFGWDNFGIGSAGSTIFIALLLLIAFLDRSAEILGSIARAKERPLLFGAGHLAQFVVTVFSGILFVLVLHKGVTGALLALLMGRFAATLCYRFLLFRSFDLTWAAPNWSDVRACLVFGLPLVPNRFAGWARYLALRPVMAHIVPMAAVGLFSLASSLATMPNIISNAIDLALAPIYFKKRMAGSPAFVDRVHDFGTVFAAALFPIWVFFIAFTPDIIRIVAGARFEAAVPVSSALFCAAYARAQQPFLMRQIHFLRATWVLPLITLPCAAISLGTAILLTSTYGIVSAGWGVVASDAALLLALALTIRQYEKVNYPLGMSFLLLTLLAALAVWVVLGEPTVVPLPRWAAKVLFVMLAMLLSVWGWLWPQRFFIRQLAQG
jgi:O-antigen/teichoic acid export membrane protein